MEEQQKKEWSEAEKKQKFQSALFRLLDANPFLGNLITEMTMRYNPFISSAAIGYNKKTNTFEVLLGNDFFCGKPLEERIAILHHEVLHFTHKHLFRYDFANKNDEERKVGNIAADMAINQYIANMPKKTVDVKEWKLPTGEPFPLNRAMEEYYQLLDQDRQQYKQNPNKSPNKDNWEKFVDGNNFDEHNWEELSEEEKEQMLSEAKKLMERTVEKTRFGYNTVPDYIKDLMREIDAQLAKLNYKGILKNAIKRTVSCVDRESTWKRANKRYGLYAPGSTQGKLPNLMMLADTSGSISHIELNQFLNTIDEFLKVGTRNCWLGFWHTVMYGLKRYKLGQKITQEELQSGGTDVNNTIEEINKKQPDLAIILTDLYFDVPSVKPNTELIWIVSDGGNKDTSFREQLPGKVIDLSNLVKK